jgi:hypothetical protein
MKSEEVLDRIDEIVPPGTFASIRVRAPSRIRAHDDCSSPASAPPFSRVRIHAAGLGGVFEDLDPLRIEQPRDI